MAEFHKTLARLMRPEETAGEEGASGQGAPSPAGGDEPSASRAATLAAVLERLRRQAAAMEERARRGGETPAPAPPGGAPGAVPETTAEPAAVVPADAWENELLAALQRRHPAAEAARLAALYGARLPARYREQTHPEDAVQDIDHLAVVDRTRESQIEAIRVSRPDETFAALRLYVADPALVLSDFVALLANFGLRVLEHEAIDIELPSAGRIWMHTFRVQDAVAPEADVVAAGSRLLPALQAIHEGQAAQDPLNALVHRAGLGWRAVDLIRAMARYTSLADRRWTYEALCGALLDHPFFAVRLHDLVAAKFDPSAVALTAPERLAGPVREAEEAVAAAAGRVADPAARERLERLAALVGRMTRTNFFAAARGGSLLPVAFRLRRPGGGDDLFVWASDLVGLYRRAGSPARGPLVWVGSADDLDPAARAVMEGEAAGGAPIVHAPAFAGLAVPSATSRGGRQRAARRFAAAVLSLTDNVDRGRTVPPPGIVSYEQADPCLGFTAEGSDPELVDLFAQVAAGQGYGLAATGCQPPEGGARAVEELRQRGAWEAAQEALRERGVDPAGALRVVCAGSLRGRAFAMGALQRRDLRLCAAFDDTHILVDPNPVPETAYWERQRLSRIGHSRWGDFNPAALGPGGGVYRVDQSAIRLSPQLRSLLRTDRETMSGEELLAAVLRMPHHVLWVGGPGVALGCAGERGRRPHLLPAAAEDLRARVVVELLPALTRRARVAMARAGRAVVAPRVAGAAGTVFSDLDALARGAIFLAAESEAVRPAVDARVWSRVDEGLRNEALRRASRLRFALRADRERARADPGGFADAVAQLDEAGAIDRAAEGLPDAEELWRRLGAEPGLTEPELDRLHARVREYVAGLARGLWPGRSAAAERFRDARFPAELPEEVRTVLARHPLGAAIAATEAADQLLTLMGATFLQRVAEETGAAAAGVLQAWVESVAFTDSDEALRELESLRGEVPPDTFAAAMAVLETSLHRCVRWLLDLPPAQRGGGTIAGGIAEAAQELLARWGELLPERARAEHEATAHQLAEGGLPEPLAEWLARIGAAADALEIAQLAAEGKVPPAAVSHAYFGAAELLAFDWLSGRLAETAAEDPWSRRARERLLRHLGLAHRDLTRAILRIDPGAVSVEECIGRFEEAHRERLASIRRLERAARAAALGELTPLAVLVLEILSLAGDARV